jgi:hypothetical protein
MLAWIHSLNNAISGGRRTGQPSHWQPSPQPHEPVDVHPQPLPSTVVGLVWIMLSMSGSLEVGSEVDS